MSSFNDIAEQQGWNSYSCESVLLGFILSIGQEQALAEYAQDVADEENEGGDES